MPKAYSIVGSNHIDGAEEYLKTLVGGAPAVLVREPSNPFDPLAIAVYVGGQRIGYIPKKQNQTLAQFIDQTGEATIMNGTPLEAAKDIMGLDNAMERTKAITGKFIRSPNSAFPMVEV